MLEKAWRRRVLLAFQRVPHSRGAAAIQEHLAHYTGPENAPVWCTLSTWHSLQADTVTGEVYLRLTRHDRLSGTASGSEHAF